MNLRLSSSSRCHTQGCVIWLDVYDRANSSSACVTHCRFLAVTMDSVTMYWSKTTRVVTVVITCSWSIRAVLSSTKLSEVINLICNRIITDRYSGEQREQLTICCVCGEWTCCRILLGHHNELLHGDRSGGHTGVWNFTAAALHSSSVTLGDPATPTSRAPKHPYTP